VPDIFDNMKTQSDLRWSVSLQYVFWSQLSAKCFATVEGSEPLVLARGEGQ
jgi:hypothetical protein